MPVFYIAKKQVTKTSEEENTPSTSHEPVEKPMFQFTVLTLQYAVFRYIGFHSPYEINYRTIKELYDYTDRWMEESAYRQTVNFHFDKVDLNLCSENYCEMDIYLPIAPIEGE